MRLQNKTTVITGGGSGIGRSTALLFAEEGAEVVVADLNEDTGKETVEMIEKNGGKAIFQYVDVIEPSDVEQLIKKTIETYGKLDVMINNAGISHPEAKIPDVPVDDWDRVVDVC